MRFGFELPSTPILPFALLPLLALMACSETPASTTANGTGGASTTTNTTSNGTGAGTNAGGAGGAGGSTETGGGAAEAAWQVVLDQSQLDGAVLSVWGSAPEDVFAVGGPLGNSGFETLAIHFDGASWRRLKPGGETTLWWVAGAASNDVWMVGEEGRITHFDGANFEEHASGVTATLWGVWAESKTSAWAVGGEPNSSMPGPDTDIVLHWDGAIWQQETLPGAPLGRALFKVWGTSGDNLYVVGEKGTIWHKTGASWVLESDGDLTTSRLFTVAGCGPTEVYAVGGSAVLKSGGQAFTKEDISLTNLVNGVACGPSGSAAVVGFGGLKQRLVQGQWIDDFQFPPYDDLHAAWSDQKGSFWVVGGDFSSGPTPGAKRPGVVARYGTGKVPGIFQP